MSAITTLDGPGFANLPTLVVQNICKHLCPKHDTPRQWSSGRKSLSCLSKTCRRFAKIVQPILFSFFSFNGQPISSIVLFLRTVSSRSDLAEQVKGAVFTDPGLESAITDDHRRIVEDCVARLGCMALPPTWALNGDNQYRLLLLELIVAQTRNLELLRIPLDYGWELKFLRNCSADTMFPSLKELQVDHFYISGDRFQVSMTEIQILLAVAPKLETLKVPTVTGYYIFDPDRSYSLGYLKTLEFTGRCSIHPGLLRGIIRSSATLKRLALSWSLENPYEYHGDWQVMDVWLALEQRRDSLHDLELQICDEIPFGQGQRVSLQDFGSLEILRVDGRALTPLRQAWVANNRHARIDGFFSQLFPQSIKEITIWNPNGSLIPSFQRLARVVSIGRYPRLSKVTISSSVPVGYEVWDEAAAWHEIEAPLQHEFKKATVDFNIATDHNY
jgi:hypothetical protein